MRRLVVILAATLFSASAFAGTWEIQHTAGGGYATAITVVEGQRLLVYGLGQDAGSDDAYPVWIDTYNGKDWTLRPGVGKTPGSMLIVNDLDCPKPSRCYALVSDVNTDVFAITNAVITSSDGGQSFNWPPSDQWLASAKNGFANMQWLSESVGWLFGGSYMIARTPKINPTHQFPYQWLTPRVNGTRHINIQFMSFVDQNVGYAATGELTKDQNGNIIGIEPLGGMIKTTDGGVTDEGWSELYFGLQEYPDGLQALTEDVIFLSGRSPDGPFFRRSEDGGATWTDIVIPAGQENFGWVTVDVFKAFDRDNAIVIVGRPIGTDQYAHSIFEMTDGTNLVEVLPNPTNFVGGYQDITCTDANNCWVVGSDLIVLKYTGDKDLPDVDDDQGTVIPDSPSQDVIEPSNDDVRGPDEGQHGAGDTYEDWDYANAVPIDLSGRSDKKSSGCSANGQTSGFVVLALLAVLALAIGIRKRSAQ